ncbi:hypothetical protein [Nocardia thailandica]|uniref:Uncharacterized protein n=1 Tax=Nocardia thailandica TaxID=257275 RepID=A0ABW6PJS6_9NOCA
MSSGSPIADLVAEHLRRVRMLRNEFEDELARLQVTGDGLLGAAEAVEEQAGGDDGTGALPEEPADGGRHRLAEGDEVMASHTAVAPRRPVTAAAALPAMTPVAGAEVAVPVAGPDTGTGDELSRREVELREAREAIARSVAARRANQNFQPVDYEGFDQESEYYRHRNWLE